MATFLANEINATDRDVTGPTEQVQIMFPLKDKNICVLFAGWEVRMVKNGDRGLENAARSCRPRAAFSRPRSQFFTIRTDLNRQLVYNIASRATQSNLVYVSVFHGQISTVLADGVSKSLRQKFLFSRERPLLAWGEYYIARQ